MFLKISLVIVIWAIYCDLEKKDNETSSFYMMILTFLILFA